MVPSLTTLDGSLTLESERYGETYRSRRGALTEARHVFLRASGVERLLAEAGAARVLEVGFGTGLNFLVTAAAAAGSGARLEYVALEREPLDGEVITALRYGELLAPFDGPAALLAWLAGPGPTLAAGEHAFDHLSTRLRLIVAEAADAMAQFGGAEFDAVYLDPFSPRANPDGWEPGLLRRLAHVLVPGGRLVTYSVSGAVRRRLTEAGLEVSKVAGPPGGKRESLVAEAPARD